MSKPQINVTPLIDVLLVLLIIFMVITPLKPSSLKTRVSAEPDPLVQNATRDTNTLLVTISKDSTLSLNTEKGFGTVTDAGPMISKLKDVFDQRIANGQTAESFTGDSDRPFHDRVERTVFIKAPKSLDFGSVARVVDAVKIAGAFPISLQIDNLD